MAAEAERSAIYAMFSTLLQPPDRKTHSEIIAGRQTQLWDALPTPLGPKPPMPSSWQAASFPDYSEWRDIYNLATSAVQPRLVPVESVYKVWTADPSCDMPFDRDKGLLQGDAAHHLYELYRRAGFELPAEYADSPDHLVLELEFMSLLVETAGAAEQRTFLDQHLDWISALISDAERRSVPGLYCDLLAWLEEFLSLERAGLPGTTR